MLTTAVLSLGAQNLVKNGDFNLYPNKLGPEFRTNGGTVVLFTEESTWNRCAKLIINKIRKEGKYEIILNEENIEYKWCELDEFVNQVTLCRNIDKIQGNIWFRTQNILSYNFPFVSPTESFNIYQYPALRPTFACDSTISLDTPQVKVTGNDLSWNSVENAEAYAVYKLKYISKNIWEPQMVSYTTQTKFKGEGESNYFVIAVNGRVKSEYDKVHFIP